MKTSTSRSFLALVAVAALAFSAGAVRAGDAPADDGFEISVGGTLFADYTYTQSPKATDADGNSIHKSEFNVGRAYLNIKGSISPRIAFRVTPDITREKGSGSSIQGSYTVRLKYGYAQVNLDELGKGSWIRFGLQQTPYVDFAEGIYRYRFEGPIFVDREHFLTSSDNGLSFHWAFPSDYGDLHVGYYNGDGYGSAETNDQKSFQARVTVRPAPGTALSGLRLTGFYDKDAYVKDGDRNRLVGDVSWQSPWLVAGVAYLKATDQVSKGSPSVDAKGWSVYATPRFPHDLEALLRYEELEPNDSGNAKKKRTIVGVSYWMPTVVKGVSASILLKHERVTYDHYASTKPDEKRWAIDTLVNF